MVIHWEVLLLQAMFDGPLAHETVNDHLLQRQWSNRKAKE